MGQEIDFGHALDLAKGIIAGVLAALPDGKRVELERMEPGDSCRFAPSMSGGIVATVERAATFFTWRVEVISANRCVLEATASTDPADSETRVLKYSPGEWERRF